VLVPLKVDHRELIRTWTDAGKIKSVDNIGVLRTLFLFAIHFGSLHSGCCHKNGILRLRARRVLWLARGRTGQKLDGDKKGYEDIPGCVTSWRFLAGIFPNDNSVTDGICNVVSMDGS
jgi:hypothetical protein